MLIRHLAKPKDQETTSIEKIVCYIHSSPKEGAYHAIGGHIRRNRVWSKGRGIKGKMWPLAFIMVSMGRNWRGRVSRLGFEKF